MTSKRSTGNPDARSPFEIALDASSDDEIPTDLPAVRRMSLMRELSLINDHATLGFVVRMSQWVLGSMKPDREDSVSLVTTMPCGVWNVSLSFGHSLCTDDADRRSSFGIVHFHTVEKTHQCCSDTTDRKSVV